MRVCAHETGKWTNTSAQLAVLKLILAGDNELQQQILESTTRRTNFDGAVPLPIWTSVDLIEALIGLADSEGFDALMEVFSGPLNACPEVLLYGVAQCAPSWGPMYDHLLTVLMRPYLTTPAGNAVLNKIWNQNKTVVIQGMVNMAAESPSGGKGLARCFEVAQEMGVLLEILSLRHSWPFVIELAMFAASQGAVPFANWAAKGAEEGGSAFAMAAVTILRK